MPNTNMISRADAEALIQEQLVSTILQDSPKSSIFMALAKKLPNMTSKQTRVKVLDMLPMACWVSGDNGFKQTSQQAWDNVYLVAEELAVIVPIPESVLDDADTDIMGEVEPRVMEAIGQRVDAAVLFGENKPSSWRMDICSTARQAGNNVPVGANPDYYDLLLGENGVISKVEESGRMVTATIGAMGMRSKLRGIKGQDGHPIFKSDMQGTTPYVLDGAPMHFPQNGAFDGKKAQLIAGDFSQAVFAIRQDITVKILDQGVIQDPATKEIIYNLAQQDMIALRVVFRMGWALPNPATRLDPNRTACAFAYLEPSVAATTQNATITVKDSSGNAVSGASVEVNGTRIKTGSDGTAVFHLLDGAYQLTVKARGYSTVQQNFSVSGAAYEADITLT